jgi:hypothetical protein
MIDNKAIYIHLGLHKTASTFFQKEFYPKHEEFNYLHLRDKEALAKFNQYILRENDLFFSKETAKDLFIQNINQEQLENSSKITLCEEQFSGFPLFDAYNRKTIFDRLNSVFPNAKFVLVLRNQKDFILSMYAEYLKKGGQETFKHFLSANKTHLNFSKGSYLQYYTYYEYICSIVGNENIKIFYYEDMKKDPLIFFKTLSAYFGLSSPINFDLLRKKENTSFPINDYETERFLNRLCKTPYSPNHFFKRKHLKFFHPIISLITKKIDHNKIVQAYIDKMNFKNELLPEYYRIKKYGY